MYALGAPCRCVLYCGIVVEDVRNCKMAFSCFKDVERGY